MNIFYKKEKKLLAWSLSKAAERSLTLCNMSIRWKFKRSVRIFPKRSPMAVRSSKIPVKTASTLAMDWSILASAAAKSSALICELLLSLINYLFKNYRIHTPNSLIWFRISLIWSTVSTVTTTRDLLIWVLSASIESWINFKLLYWPITSF